MESAVSNFRVCVDQSMVPAMYGIACANGERAERLSTDFLEVDRTVRDWNRYELSTVHFGEAVEDFRRC